MRIGFLGYLFNLAPMGIVGGDLLKAWMLAREKPGNRAKALASVVVDRIVGLYVLFLVAAAGVFVTGFWDHRRPNRPLDLLGRAHRHLRFHGGDRAGLASRVPGRAADSLADADSENRRRDRKSARRDPNLSQQAARAFLDLADDDSRSWFADAFVVLAGHGLGFQPAVSAGLFCHLSDQRHRSARFRFPPGRRKLGSFSSTRRHAAAAGIRRTQTEWTR